MERATIRVDGIVQSVGFRPFVYRTATDLDLRGTVRNRGDAGVLIELEGDASSVDAFLTRLREDPPPLAQVERVETDRVPADEPGFETFEIRDSGGGEGGGGTIPPDTATCDACLADMRDSDSRFLDYWATACVDCGPRFTVVEALPYDRPRTSMAAFPLCEDCRADYETPADRRYHAQTIACPQCGPSLQYLSNGPDDGPTPEPSAAERHPSTGRDPFPAFLTGEAAGVDAVGEAATAIASGNVVVLKGIGGAHLACDATDAAAVATLRDRTGRPEKPFAVMVPDLDAAEAIAAVDDAEREALASARRPICLLDAREDGGVTDAVAPGLHTVGVMLAYAGVHHLLFDAVDGPLVLTSANMPGRPMLTANGAIAARLGDVADGFLLHDRRIVARCDDSVARFVDGHRRLVRRSRGFAPTPVPVAVDAVAGVEGPVLGLGPELDVTAGFLASGDCYLSQYVGDVDTVATFEYLQSALEHLRSLTGLGTPRVVAHDMHPAFRTTDLARDMEREEAAVAERVPIQHHHAHAASVLAEHGRQDAIAITVDGVGYGPDGTVWGGEVLDASLSAFERVGGLAPMAMPGGDRATRHPGRMTAGVLHRHEPSTVADLLRRHDVPFPGGSEERDVVRQQLDAGVNTPTTTSAGRFLDAVSALLGCCAERTYEGEPAMKLEAVAVRGEPRPIEVPYATVEGRRVVDAPALLRRLVDLREDGTPDRDVAATAQEALADGLGELAVDAAAARGRDTVVLSGGVAYNEHIAARIRERVETAGHDFLGNERVPPGDGGIAYGQAAVAAARQA